LTGTGKRIVDFACKVFRKWSLTGAAIGLAIAATTPVHAEALLVVEADTGKVLQAENATYPWYPASVTKIMTAYVTLKAVKDGRLSLDTLLTVSPTAAAQSPSKMGFRPGIQVTVDNALKMMMVKSANDMAVVLAEGVGGSIDGFSEQMNQTAQRLGMTQTSYVNPNGLPAEGQITSARDLAILARAFIRDLPEYEYFVHIPSIRYGRRVTQNFNKLIGRFPGADGFKTGFICASGYNLVASATRNGKRLIAVVLGSSSGRARAVRAAQLLERGFANTGLAWLKPALGTVDNLAPIDASPPNLRDEMCGGKRKRPASDEDEDVTIAGNSNSAGGGETSLTFFTAGLQPPTLRPSDMIAAAAAPSEPVIVYTGPARTGEALIAANAADAAAQTVRRKKTRTAGKKPAATVEATSEAGEAGKETKPARPAGPKHAHVRPEAGAARPAERPAAAATKPAASRTAKPAAPGKPLKPAPKSTEVKPGTGQGAAPAPRS
jgi:D-alanyl-D-alanine carboxypeptidase